ncbi:MAG: SPFH domain-containing protein [Helicobacteraceae bacterium]
MLAFTVTVILFAAILVQKSIKVVSQADVLVIERLGKFHKTLTAGFNVIIPFIDQVRETLTIKEQIVNIPKQPVITKDNVNITVDGIVFVKVEDAREATYNVTNFKYAISNLAMTTLRGEIGGMDLDDTLSSRDKLNSKLQLALGSAVDNWGVKIMRVEISEISVPLEIEKAMNLQMKAEREKRAIELNAKAEKEALIRKAEALKQEKVLEAEAIERMADAKKYEQEALASAQAKAMEMINTAIEKNTKSAEFMLAKERIAAFNALASNTASQKVVVPYEASELIGSLSIISDFLTKELKK